MVSVGFDIRPLIFTRAGIKTYLYNLIRGLAKTGGCSLHLFVSSKSGIEWSELSADVSEELLRLPHINVLCERFWEEFMLPRAVKKAGCDVFHGARFFMPARLSCPAVVTVHDLAFKKIPGLVSPKSRKYFDRIVSYSVKNAEKIIVPSAATQIDLRQLYGVPEEKIAVVYEAADPEFCRSVDLQGSAALKRKLGIRGRFLLGVGTVEPRKNYGNLLKAYKMLKDKNDLQLVIVGGLGWLYEEVFQTVTDLGLKDKVIFPGHMGLPDLVRLYNDCDVFVFPSMYEGFGLPVLEALQCGACVVASNTSSIKELFSECVYPVQPANAASIAEGIEKVFSDRLLRGELKANGEKRVLDFSWQRAGQETLAVYNAIKHKRQ